MKQIIALLYAVTAMAAGAYACDACGCAATGQYLGLLPLANTHFIGLQYQYNGMESTHPSLFENRPDEHSTNYYHNLQVWGRYTISRRVQLFAFVPYRYSMQKGDTARYTTTGIGDISVIANVVAVNKYIAKWQHQLLAGGGVKLPTGAYKGVTEMDKLGLPNLQPGTGSWDFTLNANYTLKNGENGWNTDINYTLTTANRDSYKYGNRTGVSSVVFRSFRVREVDIIPQCGVRYEYALHDHDNYKRGWLNEQSGGFVTYGVCGIQAYYNKLGLRLNYAMPFSQHYSQGNVTVKQRVDAGIFYIF